MDPITLVLCVLAFIGGYALCAFKKNFIQEQYHKVAAELEQLKKKL